VSKAADAARLFKEVDSAFGRLDILVNNAGVFRFGAFAEITEESFHLHYSTAHIPGSPKPCARATINRMTFPAAVPEIPAAQVNKAAAYYVDTLGFTFDWGDDQGGIAGISRGNCRLFITNRSFRESYGNIGPILIWLNLHSKAEVDELFAQWKAAQAKIVSEPADKPWKLREFMAADLDGNLIRVFYDFRNDM
jgi:NAD(P)-dependent dehydrogenase (short-subunit alcohol dehydrogenase family)